MGPGRFRAFSAGSQPKGEVNPLALKALQGCDYPAEGFRSKSWEEFAAPGAPVMDFVFTVCDNAAGEVCPVWPGQPMTAHWGIEDPAAVEGSDSRKGAGLQQAFRYMKTRISLFTALPLRSLDAMALGSKLREIGQAEGSHRETRRRGMSASPDIIIYHNPDCGTSRNTLAMIRNAGIEPHVIEYLKTPPARALLGLADRAHGRIAVRSVLREKGTPLRELGLDDANLTDEQLLDAMMAHPILINRPIVVSPLGVKLCRPSEVVLDLLPNPQQRAHSRKRTASASSTNPAAASRLRSRKP